MSRPGGALPSESLHASGRTHSRHVNGPVALFPVLENAGRKILKRVKQPRAAELEGPVLARGGWERTLGDGR